MKLRMGNVLIERDSNHCVFSKPCTLINGQAEPLL